MRDVAVGAVQDDDGGFDRGAIWMLFIDGTGCTVPVALQGFRSHWTGNHVEVGWRLIGASGALTFEVSRMAESSGAFAKIGEVDVVRRGDEFIFEDHSTDPETTYRYRVVISENGEAVALFETEITTPSAALVLHQNRPNPFNPTTRIRFIIDEADHVSLGIYDISGRRVRTLVNRPMRRGSYTETWDGRDTNGNAVASGVYFYRLAAGKRTITRKAVLLR